MISRESQEIVDNTIYELKKVWLGKLCIVIDNGRSRHYTGLNGTNPMEPFHYIKMATKDPYECDTFGYVDGKQVRPSQKPVKFGDWYFGDKSRHENININSVVLVVDIVRSIYGTMPHWAAIILYKEKNWMVDLRYLALDARD